MQTVGTLYLLSFSNAIYLFVVFPKRWKCFGARGAIWRSFVSATQVLQTGVILHLYCYLLFVSLPKHCKCFGAGAAVSSLRAIGFSLQAIFFCVGAAVFSLRAIGFSLQATFFCVGAAVRSLQAVGFSL